MLDLLHPADTFWNAKHGYTHVGFPADGAAVGSYDESRPEWPGGDLLCITVHAVAGTRPDGKVRAVVLLEREVVL